MAHPEMIAVIRFGPFELEPQVGVLRKHGVRIRLQEQPLRVLLALIDKRGEPVSREELRERIWAESPFGDFDHSLNIAVNKIREALGDSAENSRYVETLPRRGYRFIGVVEGSAPTTAPGAAPAAAAEAVAPAPPPKKRRVPRWALVTGIAAAVLVVASGGIALLPSTPPQLEWHRITNDNSAKDGPVLSDGARLYFRSPPYGEGRLRVVQVPVSGGEPTELPIAPPPGRYFAIVDISPDGQELLVSAHASWGVWAGSLWTLGIANGVRRPVGNLIANWAHYSPDGKQIAFVSGGTSAPASGSLWVAASDGSGARRLLEAKRRVYFIMPVWSPNGRRIAFAQYAEETNELSTWEITADGTKPRQLFPDWKDPHFPAGWTPSGRLLLESRGQLWTVQEGRFFGLGRLQRVQLTYGEPLFYGPLQPRDNRTFYDVGTTLLGQLQRYDTRSKNWEPHLGGISAESVEYSRDGQRVLYTTYPEGGLWVRAADGSRPLPLTRAPIEALIGRWSPDGRLIAFTGQSGPGKQTTIYLADAAGGNTRLGCALKECEGAVDLAWMPDGKRIVYDVYGPPLCPAAGKPCLLILDLANGQVTKFPGSDFLHSPRMSPDGSVLAALRATEEGNKLMLYRFSEKVWREVEHAGLADWPSWSHDSQWIWYYDQKGPRIVRYRARDDRLEKIVPLKLEDMAGRVGFWFALTPSDEPMTLRRHDIQQVYALSWKER